MLPGVFLRALHQIRSQDWWAYKIPPLLAWAYASTLVTGSGSLHALVTLGAVLISISFVGAYGYLINDAFDIEDDRRSGKPNGMNGKPVWMRSALCAGACLAAFVPLLWVNNYLLFLLLVVNLLLPTLYSIPPVRLKNRGLWGAIADASGACAVPAASMVLAGALPSPAPVALLTCTVGCAFLAGFRGIVTHQVLDLDADSSAGVSTFARRLGRERARTLVLRGIVPCEAASLAAFLILVFPVAPLLLVFSVLWLGLEALKMHRRWKLSLFQPPGGAGESYIPLVNNEYYETWLPLSLAIQLACAHSEYALVLAFQAVAFFPYMRKRFAALTPLFRRSPAVQEVIAAPPAEAAVSTGADFPRARVRGRVQSSGRPLEVIVGTPSWTVNGVNVFSANLVRGLNAAGVPAHVLLTEEDSDLVSITERLLPRPPDVTFTHLPVKRWEPWGAHWGTLVRYLEEHAPCIYIPNSDWRHSCVTPLLSDAVLVVGIVHSDDPLHYDHVRRLGRYWNSIVAVSNSVREKTLRECPELSERTCTIPIGVEVPPAMPQRTRRPGQALRVIYHGILKQHQKRVLDLPRIVAAALERGTSIQMSIVGAGPDEELLRQAAQPLVERGAIRFHGVLGHAALGRVMEEHDVFLLPSEFEGMPNALIESMAHGCVPIVSRVDSGIPELIRDGENGYLAPVGDIAIFADRLGELWNDTARCRAMSAAAYQTVASGSFDVQSMVRAYVEVFDRVARDAEQGRFMRPQGCLEPPPAEVAGVNIFPLQINHQESGVGMFPSVDDAEEFLQHRDRQAAVPAERGLRSCLGDVTVIAASPLWVRNGINVFTEDLVRGLQREGIASRLLLTEENTPLIRVSESRVPRPDDIPVDELSVGEPDNWGRHWGAMQRYLHEHAPCIYIPNYDWRHSCIAPRLGNEVSIVGIVHAVDPFYFDHIRRLGPYMNAIVAASPSIGRQLRLTFPGLTPRLKTILCSADVPNGYPERTPGRRPLRVLVAGVGDQDTAFPLQIGALIKLTAGAGVSVGFTCLRRFVTGQKLPAGAQWLEEPSRMEWLTLFESHDVLLTSMSTVAHQRLKEAMGRGCVPVLAGGAIPDFVVNERNGFYVVKAAVRGQAEREVAGILSRLATDDQLLPSLSLNAYGKAVQGTMRTADMVAEYLELFAQVRAEVDNGLYHRHPAPIQLPPAKLNGISVFPVALKHVVDGVGAFPSKRDFRDYLQELEPKEYQTI